MGRFEARVACALVLLPFACGRFRPWGKGAPLEAVSAHAANETRGGGAFVEAVKAWDVREAFVLAPGAYAAWWTRLLRDAPEHVFVETLLVCLLIYLLLSGTKRRSARDGKLSEREIDELVRDWAPEPLVPAQSGVASEIVSRWKVVESADEHGFVTLRGKARSEEGTSPLFSKLFGGAESAPAKLLNCASFDFLGMSGSSRVRDAAAGALRRYGCGSCGPRGFYGSIDVHEDLEVRVAKFMGCERAIAFSDSASCCTSTVAAFAKRGDLLVVDDAVCEPLRTGCCLSRATVVPFAHNDPVDLERVLAAVAADDAAKQRDPRGQRRFVVSEAVSRDVGDVAPLAALVALKDKYGYRLVLDESLSVGVLGDTGRGLKEACGIEDATAVEITTVDMSPAFGSLGGLCVGTDEVIDHQRLSGAGYCFSAAAPPFYSAAALAALDLVDAEGGRAALANLRANARALHAGLEAHFGATAGHPLLALVNESRAHEKVPFALLKLADPSPDAGANLKTLEDLVDALIARGFCLSVAKYDESVYGRASKNTALPALRPKPLALKVAVTSKHDPATVAAIVAAVVDCAN